MDLVVVYKANPDSVQQALGYLRKEGFNPVVPGSSSPISFHWVVRQSQKIEIAVPREETPGAASVLRKCQQANESEVRTLTKNLARYPAYSTVATAILALVFLLFDALSDAAPLLFLAWLVIFALLANSETIRHKFKSR